jgi:hypothetical protein
MTTPDPIPQSELTPEQLAAKRETERQQRNVIIGVSVVLLLILAGMIWAVFKLMSPATPVETVTRLRDVFLIVMALLSLFIGFALVVLIIQVTSLINLLQNEVRPILQATTETVNNLRGTAEFLGENVVQPVIKLNGYMAGLQRVIELIGIKRR